MTKNLAKSWLKIVYAYKECNEIQQKGIKKMGLKYHKNFIYVNLITKFNIKK